MSDSFTADIQDVLKAWERFDWAPEGTVPNRQGVERLISAGIDTYDHFYRLLRDESADEYLRKNAFDLIRYLTKKIDKRRVVPPLLSILQHPNSPLKRIAIYALGTLGSKRAIAPLLKIVLDRQESEDNRSLTISALSFQHLSQRAFEAFFPLLTDKTDNPTIRSKVIKELCFEWDGRAVSPLVQCLSDESEEVRFWACFGLFRLSRYATAALLELDRLAAADTGYGMWAVRREALGAVERICYWQHLADKPEAGEVYRTARIYLISPLIEYDDFYIAGLRPEGIELAWSPIQQSTDLRIDPAWLAERLREVWPEVRLNVRQPKLQSLLLDWEIGSGKSLLFGGLQNDGYALSFTCNDLRQVTAFALWIRSIITAQHKLFIYHWADEGVEITSDLTVEKLAAFWSSPR